MLNLGLVTTHTVLHVKHELGKFLAITIVMPLARDKSIRKLKNLKKKRKLALAKKQKEEVKAQDLKEESESEKQEVSINNSDKKALDEGTSSETSPKRRKIDEEETG